MNVRPDESGPEPHFHRAITESFYVLSGEVRLYDGTGWKAGGPGDFFHVPCGGLHGFRGRDHASMLLMFAPVRPGALLRDARRARGPPDDGRGAHGRSCSTTTPTRPEVSGGPRAAARRPADGGAGLRREERVELIGDRVSGPRPRRRRIRAPAGEFAAERGAGRAHAAVDGGIDADAVLHAAARPGTARDVRSDHSRTGRGSSPAGRVRVAEAAGAEREPLPGDRSRGLAEGHPRT